MYRGMAGLNGFGITDALAWQVTPDQWWCLALSLLVVYLPLAVPAEAARSATVRQLADATWAVGPLLGFLIGGIALYSRAAVPFLYFQF